MALESFTRMMRHIGRGLVVLPKRFTVLILYPKFVSSELIISSEMQVGMPLMNIIKTRSSGIEKVKNGILFSLRYF